MSQRSFQCDGPVEKGSPIRSTGACRKCHVARRQVTPLGLGSEAETGGALLTDEYKRTKTLKIAKQVTIIDTNKILWTRLTTGRRRPAGRTARSSRRPNRTPIMSVARREKGLMVRGREARVHAHGKRRSARTLEESRGAQADDSAIMRPNVTN
ncbi:hypothetical protein EVAR_95968_1 [Eumeta japonica]|uniref:Uncharacterized protein n=1 Tax=Eumeta variegata TaxID=151549 RepID=A0A4C1V7Q8_EUMVA|nr:hypothetical protein EVAR_95968_1 [Eumeta japonica]